MGSFFNWVLLLLVVSLVAVYFFGAGLGRIFKRLRGNSSIVGNDGVNSKGSKNSDASKDGNDKVNNGIVSNGDNGGWKDGNGLKGISGGIGQNNGMVGNGSDGSKGGNNVGVYLSGNYNGGVKIGDTNGRVNMGEFEGGGGADNVRVACEGNEGWVEPDLLSFGLGFMDVKGEERLLRVVNPFRGVLVVGGTGSGKTRSLAHSFLYQGVLKGYTGLVYDFKFPDLTSVAQTAYRDGLVMFGEGAIGADGVRRDGGMNTGTRSGADGRKDDSGLNGGLKAGAGAGGRNDDRGLNAVLRSGAGGWNEAGGLSDGLKGNERRNEVRGSEGFNVDGKGNEGFNGGGGKGVDSLNTGMRVGAGGRNDDRGLNAGLRAGAGGRKDDGGLSAEWDNGLNKGLRAGVDNWRGERMARQFVLDFNDPLRSCRVNPLHPRYIPSASFAQEYATVIVNNLVPESIKGMDFWMRSAVALLQASIWYFVEEFPELCSLPAVVAFVQSDIGLVLGCLRKNAECERMVSSVLTAYDNKSEAQLSGVVGSLQVMLNRLMLPEVVHVLSGDDVLLDLNHPDHPSLLLMGSSHQTKETYAPVVSLICAVSLKMMNVDGRRQSMVLLDEAPTLYVPGLETVPASGRSRLMSVMFLAQDLSQVVDMYGRDKKDVLLSNLMNQFYGRVGHADTAGYVSGLFGKRDVAMESRSVNRGSSDSQGRSGLGSLAGGNSNEGMSVSVGVSSSLSWQERLVLRPEEVLQLPVGVFASMLAEPEPDVAGMKVRYYLPMLKEDLLLRLRVNGLDVHERQELKVLMRALLRRVDEDVLRRVKKADGGVLDDVGLDKADGLRVKDGVGQSLDENDVRVGKVDGRSDGALLVDKHDGGAEVERGGDADGVGGGFGGDGGEGGESVGGAPSGGSYKVDEVGDVKGGGAPSGGADGVGVVGAAGCSVGGGSVVVGAGYKVDEVGDVKGGENDGSVKGGGVEDKGADVNNGVTRRKRFLED